MKTQDTEMLALTVLNRSLSFSSGHVLRYPWGGSISIAVLLVDGTTGNKVS